jgi:hypothetical protein
MLSPSWLDLFGGGASMMNGSGSLGMFLLGGLAIGDLIAARTGSFFTLQYPSA